MKTTHLYILAFATLLISSCHNKYQLLNQLDPVVMSINGANLIQYWEFPNENYLWSNHTGEVKEIVLYKDSLVNILGEEKYREAVDREGKIDLNYLNEDEILNGDQKNAALIHHGTLGTLREINFLEAQLLNYQLAKYPLLGHPTEFVAYIETHDVNNLVRVYFGSSDQPWPPKHHSIFLAIEKDLNQGWKLKYALHNHYEPKDNNYVGILAPSMSDVQMFKMMKENYNLEKALITNGFSTVIIENENFEKLESH